MAYNILVKGFCPLKSTITRFPNGFHLNTNTSTVQNSMLLMPVLHVYTLRH